MDMVSCSFVTIYNLCTVLSATNLANTVVKMPEQHFPVVYPWGCGQPLHFEQISLVLALLQPWLLFII